MIDRLKCKHKNIIKIGKAIFADGYHQRYRCKDCGTILKGEKVTSYEPK